MTNMTKHVPKHYGKSTHEDELNQGQCKNLDRDGMKGIFHTDSMRCLMKPILCNACIASERLSTFKRTSLRRIYSRTLCGYTSLRQRADAAYLPRVSVEVGRLDGRLDFVEDDQFLCHVQTLRSCEILCAESEELNQRTALVSQMLIEGEAA